MRFTPWIFTRGTLASASGWKRTESSETARHRTGRSIVKTKQSSETERLRLNTQQTTFDFQIYCSQRHFYILRSFLVLLWWKRYVVYFLYFCLATLSNTIGFYSLWQIFLLVDIHFFCLIFFWCCSRQKSFFIFSSCSWHDSKKRPQIFSPFSAFIM